MSTAFTRTCIAVAFGAVALTSQPCAWSAEPSAIANVEEREPFAFTFRFSADELASGKSAARVYQDLKRKAARACTIKVVPGSRIQHVDRRCAAELVATVVQQVGSNTLAEQHSHTAVVAAGR